MQTFLPYPDFAKSAACLDNKRLGKQRVECLQILKALTEPSYGWQNHPAVKMWRSSPSWLCLYAASVILEWRNRGFKDTCLEKLHAIQRTHDLYRYATTATMWLGSDSFHASHRSNLLRKDPAHYSQFGWQEPSDLPYVWPV